MSRRLPTKLPFGKNIFPKLNGQKSLLLVGLAVMLILGVEQFAGVEVSDSRWQVWEEVWQEGQSALAGQTEKENSMDGAGDSQGVNERNPVNSESVAAEDDLGVRATLDQDGNWVPATETSAGGSVEGSLGEAYLVTRVVDGDTFKVRSDRSGKEETVRVIGIDTPETVHPSKPVECFGTAASNFAKQLLMGQKVFLEVDDSQDQSDRYGRWLRLVTLPNGEDYGAMMLKGGYAYEYTYRAPYAQQVWYKQLEATAQATGAGLWASDVCN